MTGPNRQQQPQMPVNQQQQVPDHRLQELENRLRQMEMQNTQLRTTVDFLRQGPQQGQPQPQQDPAFKPEVQAAIDARVKQMVQPLEERFKQQVGYLADQNDDLRYQLNYGGDKYKPYHSKVEQIREQARAENRYITREQALQLAYFEDGKGKNPTPDPQQAKQEPVFDPYFNGFVDPVTRKPIGQSNTQEAQPQEEPMQEQQYQQPQQPQMQQPQHGMQQPGAGQRGYHPNGNAFGQPQQFNLPSQGMNPQAPSHQSRDGRAPLDINSSDADLQAFEDNFGDLPL